MKKENTGNDNGYNGAYPSHIKLKNKEIDEPFAEYVNLGLTKREYFAGLALTGYASAGSTGMPTEDELAVYAVKTADALLKELAKDVE